MPTAPTPNLIYCTSFCNFGHVLATGRPIDHECYIIPSKLLIAERDQLPDYIDQWAIWTRTAKRAPVIGRPLDKTWMATGPEKHAAWVLGDPEFPLAIVAPQWVSPRAAGDGKPDYWTAQFSGSANSRKIPLTTYQRLATLAAQGTRNARQLMPQHASAAHARRYVDQAIRTAQARKAAS